MSSMRARDALIRERFPKAQDAPFWERLYEVDVRRAALLVRVARHFELIGTGRRLTVHDLRRVRRLTCCRKRCLIHGHVARALQYYGRSDEAAVRSHCDFHRNFNFAKSLVAGGFRIFGLRDLHCARVLIRRLTRRLRRAGRCGLYRRGRRRTARDGSLRNAVLRTGLRRHVLRLRR